MNVALILGGAFAGLGVVGLTIVGSSQLSIGNSQQIDRQLDLPLLVPIVSSELTADRGDLSTRKQQLSQLESARSALNEATAAVRRSQARLAQARINLVEFQAQHNDAKILSAQGRVSRQYLATAQAARDLAKLQHRSALFGLQASTSQLVIARSAICKLGRKANIATKTRS